MSLYEHVSHLADYFNNGLSERKWATGKLQIVGMEVETSFVDAAGLPISTEQSQKIFLRLCMKGWEREDFRQFTRSVRNATGDRIQYDLGRQNIELSAAPRPLGIVIQEVRLLLEQLYEEAAKIGAYPRFKPIFETDEDLLVIPDERDTTWLAVDGRKALAPLARTSAVQFTVEVPREKAIPCLNRLGQNAGVFLKDYPQEEIWRTYITESKAGYKTNRYGGPLTFGSINSYCLELMFNDVVTPEGLKSHHLDDFSFRLKTREEVTLFLRSVWWYFRLRRYGEQLCIEVRPLARREDNVLEDQLTLVLNTLNL